MSQQRILLTGGAGYIGSHTCLALLQQGYSVVVIDDLSNSSEESLRRVRELAARDVVFHRLDLRDEDGVDAALSATPVDAVIHFAGLKAVGESVAQPLRYYDVNVGGAIALLHALERHEIKNLVFSSSATVYGDPEQVPVTERSPLSATNPYGRTKLYIESMLADVAAADPHWNIALLRYFNPVGAHESGRIGEDPLGTPNNLMPYIMQVAVGRHPRVTVFGDDYPTRDGTGVRDYIHVVDLAEGHVAALRNLAKLNGCRPLNLGTGQGHTVLEAIGSASAAVGFDIPYVVGERRAGDVAESWADTSQALELLGWRATRTLDDICHDAWRWQSANPNGYRDSK